MDPFVLPACLRRDRSLSVAGVPDATSLELGAGTGAIAGLSVLADPGLKKAMSLTDTFVVRTCG